MSETPEGSTDGSRRRRSRAEIDAIFGDDLPATTRDERDESGRDPRGPTTSDQWHLNNVPPHHG
ncbi:hypothetical protein [Jongsikchunia kroppenstedtii]|uniref:hypothetical protein n=1 Tax=Jongsikchunia kroppenstedtii TaxID=1121721 RepID=UPI0003698892|nr:hypothetical protein [Jongsikchunia kroppenstedtii]